MNLLVPGGGQSQGDENQQTKLRWQAMSVLFRQHPAPELRSEAPPQAVIAALLDKMAQVHKEEDILVDERDTMLTNSDPGFGLTIWRRRLEPVEVTYPPLENQYDDDDSIQDLEPVDIDFPPMQHHDLASYSTADGFEQCYNFWNDNFEDQDFFAVPNNRRVAFARNEKSFFQKILERTLPSRYRRIGC